MSGQRLRADEILRRIPRGESRGAEIGVYKGGLSARLLKARPRLHLLLVDPWVGAERSSDSYKASGDRRAFDPQGKMDGYFRATRRAVRFAGDRAEIIRAFSVEVAPRVPDASLDFVFIDGDHSYEGCSADIAAWTPKLRPGGLLGGHDYSDPWPGVVRAVDEAVEAHGWALDLGRAACWFVRLP
jgi:hypothetical protein